MRRALALLALAGLSLLAACGDDTTAGTTTQAGATTTTAAGTATFTPLAAGTLTVGTNLPAPGFWNGDDPSSITGGYEYGIAQELAKRLGLSSVKVVNVSFDALVAGQAQGFDVAFSQVTITDDRAKVVDFTVSYFSSDQGVLVNKGTAVPDLAAAKKLQWGVQQSTTAQEFLAAKVKPEKEVRVYGETTQAFTALQAKQVDAVLLDTSIVLGQAAQPGSPFEVVAQFQTGERYGGIVPKGSKNLAAMDKILREMDTDGTFKNLSDQYLSPEFGGDPAEVAYIEVS